MEQGLLELRKELKELRRKEKEIRNKIKRIERGVQIKESKGRDNKNKGNKKSSWKEVFEEIKTENENRNIMNIRTKVPLREMED